MGEKEQLYKERLNRYGTALYNGKPDRVPIRVLVEELAAILYVDPSVLVKHKWDLFSECNSNSFKPLNMPENTLFRELKNVAKTR